MADILTGINTRRTPQNQKASPEQVRNNAGGYVYQISDHVKIHRFLTLGTEGGTYYQNARDLTASNANTVLAAARDNGEWLVQQVLAISVAGRAPRQNPAIFALAAASGLGSDPARKAALNALPLVCRTGYHMFLFARYVQQFRGWGRGLCRAVSSWYTNKEIEAISYQVAKYRQREGWSNRDLLRLSHPNNRDYDPLFAWITRGTVSEDTPPLVRAHVEAMTTTDLKTWLRLIAAHPLSWEMLPDAALNEAEVWAALIEKGLPQTALMRQLPRLTNLGLFHRRDVLQRVVAQLKDPERLRRGRVHPVNVLVAQKVYANGVSVQGTSKWTPVRQVVDALDEAFYQAFGAVEAAGKRTLVALDVSGSMSPHLSGLPISAREVAAALALVTLATEVDVTCVGFTGGGWHSSEVSELSLSPRQRLNDAMRSIINLPFGRTDCSLPMRWAQSEGREFDTFEVLTDNETWYGEVHPRQALRSYRETSGINARLAVVGLTATDFSIADPSDPGSLDVAGFDSNVPSLVADFSRGLI